MSMLKELEGAKTKAATLQTQLTELTEKMTELSTKLTEAEAATSTAVAEATKPLQVALDAKTKEATEASGKVTVLTGQVSTLTTERDGFKTKAELAHKALRDPQYVDAALKEFGGGASSTTDAEADALEQRAAAAAAGKETDQEAVLKEMDGKSAGEQRNIWKRWFAKKNATAVTAILILLASGFGAQARQYDQEILHTADAETNSTGTEVSVTVVGEIYEIVVVIPSGTVDVSVATSDGLTLFAKDSNTGTNVYRPRFDMHSYAGVAIGAGTEAVALTVPSFTNDVLWTQYDTNGVANATVTGTVAQASQSLTGTLGLSAYVPAVVVGTVTANFNDASTTNLAATVRINFRE